MVVKSTNEAAVIYEKFVMGSPISDAELRVGVEHFKRLADLAHKSGPVFRLAAKEAARVTDALESYLKARTARADKKVEA